MTIISIVLSTTDILKLPIESLSIYRVCLLLTFLFSLAHILFGDGKIKKGRYMYIILLILISSPIALIISINKSWAVSFLLNDYMGIILIFLVCNYFDKNDYRVLIKAFVNSHFITIGYSLYTFFIFYFKGGLPNYIEILKIFHITLDKEFISRAQIYGKLRLSLPYATPPALSVVIALVVCILIYYKTIYPPIIRFALIVAYTIILILTYSRTGVVALGLAIIFIGIYKSGLKRVNFRTMIVILSSLALISVVLFFINNEVVWKYINRFKVVDILSNRHFLVPIEGIIIWISDVKNFVFGIGYGSSIYMDGKFTYLPPSFLNSFVTLVAEKGILGLLLDIELFRIAKKFLRFMRNRTCLVEIKILYYTYYIILFAFIFYELKQYIGVWIVMSIIIMFDSNDSKNLDKRELSSYV